MSFKNIIICFFILFSALIKAEKSIDIFPEIILSDIPEGEIVRKDYFNKKTLWGYIDGGADIYLEYGFDKLLVEEINWHNQHFKVEVFKMDDQKAAFGIYSLLKSNCSSKDSISEYFCGTPYQTVAFENSFFISLINDTGTDEAMLLSSRIIKILLNRISPIKFKLPDLFLTSEFLPFKKDVKYFNGKLGLQNSLPEMADQFENFNNYTVYFLPVELKEGYLNLFIINLKNDKDILEFYSRNGIPFQENRPSEYTEQKGLYKSVTKLKSGEIIYTETNLSAEIRKKYLTAAGQLTQ